MKGLYIVDAHMHLGQDAALYRRDTGFEALLSAMGAFGIRRAYSSHYLWIYSRFKDAVRASVEGWERSEGSVPFLGVYNPMMEKESLGSFDECLKHEGFIGIKIHPSQHRLPADDPRYGPVWEYARSNRLPILSHTWSITENPVQRFSVPHLFERYIEEYPEVSFIMGHGGGRGQGRKEAAALARKHPNVFMDIAGDIFCLDLIAKTVEALGAEKLLFGTDWPWFDARVYLPRVLLAPVTDEDKALILGLNALRIFEPELLKLVDKDAEY